VSATDDVRASEALRLASELAAPVAAVRRERRARRFEAARRLGLAHPSALATTTDVTAAARAFFDATQELAKELHKRAAKKNDGRWGAGAAILASLARDATEGWPARLNGRWLDEVFKPLAPRGVAVRKLPPALGGASFLRAASAWGYAWRTS